MIYTERNNLWVEVGWRLKSLRESRNMTLQDVVNALNGEISRSLVGMWETGERQIKIELLCRLADYYGTTTDYLLGRSRCMTADATLDSAVRYTETSEKVIENIRAVSCPPVTEYMENDKFQDVCLSVADIHENLENLKDALQFAEEKEAEISPDSDLERQRNNIADASALLMQAIKLSKLSIYELSEKNSDLIDDLYGYRSLLKRAQNLYEALESEYETLETEFY